MTDVDRPVLRAGDRAQVTVRGLDRQARAAALERIAADAELERQLVPSPIAGLPEVGDFGDLTAVQEFIVAAAAGVSAEGLVAGVRAALRRRGRADAVTDDDDAKPLRVTVTATPLAPGVVEVAVTLEGPAHR